MQTAPPPDVDRLIIGGAARRRRRTWVRVGVGAAVAVLVAGGAYGVTRAGTGSATEPPPATSPPSTTTTAQAYPGDQNGIDPGTYRMLVGNDDNGVAINADLTFDSTSWQDGNYPVLDDGGVYGGVAVYQPLALSAGTGCLNDRVNDNRPDTPQALAQKLAQLPASTVLRAPEAVQAFGREAVHLQLLIVPDCGNGIYRIAMTLRGGHGISYGPGATPTIVDFWTMDVGGVPLVVETWHQDGASNLMLAHIARTRDSVAFETGG